MGLMLELAISSQITEKAKVWVFGIVLTPALNMIPMMKTGNTQTWSKKNSVQRQNRQILSLMATKQLIEYINNDDESNHSSFRARKNLEK